MTDQRNANGKIQHWKISADPIKQDETGVRHFFVDETGVFRWAMAQPADEKSGALQSPNKMKNLLDPVGKSAFHLL